MRAATSPLIMAALPCSCRPGIVATEHRGRDQRRLCRGRHHYHVRSETLIGNPQPGDLLGAVNGRTFTGDTSQSGTLERSTLLIDHTFVKRQRGQRVAGGNLHDPRVMSTARRHRAERNSMVSLQASNPGSASGHKLLTCRSRTLQRSRYLLRCEF